MANEVRTSVGNALADQGIDYVHWECHKGKLNHYDHVFYTVANNGSANVLVATGTNKECHVVFDWEANGRVQFQMMEDALPGAGSSGTASTHVNKNRSFTTSAGTVWTYACDMTNGTEGTVVFSGLITGSTGGGAGPAASDPSGGDRSHSEWILKPNTQYLFSACNTSQTVVDIYFSAEFYEE